MNIGEMIKLYRTKTKLSLRDFAEKCGTSHSYISMLENEKNSKTGEPIVPSLSALQKIAKGLEISLNELISICDDMPVSLNTPEEPKLTEGDAEWLSLFRAIPVDLRDEAVQYVRSALKIAGLLR